MTREDKAWAAFGLTYVGGAFMTWGALVAIFPPPDAYGMFGGVFAAPVWPAWWLGYAGYHIAAALMGAA